MQKEEKGAKFFAKKLHQKAYKWIYFNYINIIEAMNVMVMLILLSTVRMVRGDATQVDMPMLSNGVAASHNFCESLLSSGMKKDDAGEGVTLDTSPPILNDADTVWPALELNWRVAVGSIIAFLGGSLGCAGGIGGGGIFVPMLVLVIGFDEKSSTALSKCMIMGASAASVCYQLTLKSATIDYDLALIFHPAPWQAHYPLHLLA